MYQVKKEQLSLLEQQNQENKLDIYYADESSVSETGYVPYGWQFEDEQVFIPAQRGSRINCFAMISRDNKLVYKTTSETINASFVLEQLEAFSFAIKRPTIVVLDNASVHTAHKIKERLSCWRQRGLFLFYLPPYSPHLNICERLWKELKARWLKPSDYKTTEALFYAVDRALAAVGYDLEINFSDFNLLKTNFN